jgi:integrase
MRLDNPAQGLERNREEKRARYLSATELPRLLAAIHKHEQRQGARAILLLLLTGARRAEVLTATWNQFDLDHGVWTKPAASTKQKALHHVPLSNPAIELLKQIQQESVLSEFLFPARDGGHRIDIKKDWAQVCRAAGITGLRLHDLRHSYASMLVSAGLSLPIVGALLGHSQASTTQRYAHLADDPLRQATAKVGQIVVDAGRK